MTLSAERQSRMAKSGLVAALIALLLWEGCKGTRRTNPMIDIHSVFTAEARAQGMEVKQTLPDGRVVVAFAGRELTVSLDNIARNAIRDGDAASVKRFVAAIRETPVHLPPWPEARQGIRYSAEPADQQFGDSRHQRVTDTLARVFVYADPLERDITGLTPSALRTWKVSLAEVEGAAEENMAWLLSHTRIEVEAVDQYKLGWFETDSVFKAAMVFAPNFKEKVQPEFGWPVYVVVPCRDFAYVFAERDRNLIPRLGRVVVREYEQSGYPITAEVLEVSDHGIRAIGSYQSKGQALEKPGGSRGRRIG